MEQKKFPHHWLRHQAIPQNTFYLNREIKILFFYSFSEEKKFFPLCVGVPSPSRIFELEWRNKKPTFLASVLISLSSLQSFAFKIDF